MIRSAAIKTLDAVAHRVGAPLLLIALIFQCSLPSVDPRDTYISESNFKLHAASLVEHEDFQTSSMVTEGAVFASRGAGGPLTVIFVNELEEASMRVATAVVARLRKERHLSGDVVISLYRDTINVSAVMWQLSSIDVAVVLNVSYRGSASLCLDVFGSDGIQPNLDIVNIAVSAAARFDQALSVTCRRADRENFPHMQRFINAAVRWIPSPQRDYFSTLLSAITQRRSHGASALRKEGVHPIVLQTLIKSQHEATEIASSQLDAVKLSRVVESIVRSVNNLDERLHHSFPIYAHLDSHHFVDFEVSQHSVFIVLAALGSVAYGECLKANGAFSGRSFIGVIALVICGGLFDTSTVATNLHTATQVGFAVVVSGGVAALCKLHEIQALLAVWNGIVVCLLVVLQPHMAVVASLALATQQVVLSAAVAELALLISGSLSWVLYSLLELSASHEGIAPQTVLFAILPNLFAAVVLIFRKRLLPALL